MMDIKRRTLMWSMAAMASPLPGLVFGQDSVLPLRTPGLDHLDVMVPDVEVTARFYMGLLNTELHAQAFQGGNRYFVLLSPLKAGRETSYLAVGDARGRGTYIGHFCTTVQDWRRDSQAIFRTMGEEFAAAGFGEFPGSTGFAGVFKDPDDIEIQFLPAPDTLVTAAEPSMLVPWHQGLVTPHGVDHVLLRVSNLERALAWYSILYGAPTWNAASTRVWFEFPASNTRIYLEQFHYEYGQKTGIEHYGIKVSPFDRAAVEQAVAGLGGTVLPDAYEQGALRIRDPDGNIVELKAI
jgi:catechol 2,3-dioxygenase-like lactoylglutathione lyase family enzyme